MKDVKLSEALRGLWGHITAAKKIRLCWLAPLIVFSAVCEIMVVGMAMPFIELLIASGGTGAGESFILSHDWLGRLSETGSLNLPTIAALFMLIVIISSITRLVVLWSVTRFAFEVGAEISTLAYKKVLQQPYMYHIQGNTSETIAALTIKSEAIIGNTIRPVLLIVSNAVILVLVGSALSLVDFQVALVVGAGIAVIYYATNRVVYWPLVSNSKVIAKLSSQTIRMIQESVGGVRDVIIDRSADKYVDVFRVANHKLRVSQGNNSFLGDSPRYLIEGLGMVLLIYVASREGSSNILPILGAIGVATQRLLPVAQQTFVAWSSLNGYKASLVDVVEILKLEAEPNLLNEQRATHLTFEREILLRNVSFKYPNSDEDALTAIDLSIKKGEKIGIVGETGSGKSTLLDMFTGLIVPSTGAITVDGRELHKDVDIQNWQRLLSHVPQNIFLLDGSIEENITLGRTESVNDIDNVINIAQLLSVLDKKNYGLNTPVGERGVQLSGGERQRIGIARALFKKSSVLILDEATSALDLQTESSLMHRLYDEMTNVTVIIVAHRVTTLALCDRIYRVEGGGLCEVGYDDLVPSGNPEHRTA